MSTLWLLPAQVNDTSRGLSAVGATIMTLSVLLVLGLCAFCFWRILREAAPSEHHHAPLDIDTRDLDE